MSKAREKKELCIYAVPGLDTRNLDKVKHAGASCVGPTTRRGLPPSGTKLGKMVDPCQTECDQIVWCIVLLEAKGEVVHPPDLTTWIARSACSTRRLTSYRRDHT